MCHHKGSLCMLRRYGSMPHRPHAWVTHEALLGLIGHALGGTAALLYDAADCARRSSATDAERIAARASCGLARAYDAEHERPSTARTATRCGEVATLTWLEKEEPPHEKVTRCRGHQVVTRCPGHQLTTHDHAKKSGVPRFGDMTTALRIPRSTIIFFPTIGPTRRAAR